MKMFFELLLCFLLVICWISSYNKLELEHKDSLNTFYKALGAKFIKYGVVGLIGFLFMPAEFYKLFM